MSKSNLPNSIKTFLDNESSALMELTFSTLEINITNNERLLNQSTMNNCKIFIKRQLNSNYANMDIVDNPAFRFAFLFTIPLSFPYYHEQMIELPRPLTGGILRVGAYSLILNFIIDAPDPNLKIHVSQLYYDLSNIKIRKD